MNINWNEVFSTDFWFSLDRAGLHKSDYAIFYFGLALVAFGIALTIYKKTANNKFLKKVAGRVATIFMTIGVMEALWFGLRYENTSALGTKFTAVLILLAGLVWLYFPVRYLMTRYKTDMAEAERQVMRDKYLNRKR